MLRCQVAPGGTWRDVAGGQGRPSRAEPAAPPLRFGIGTGTPWIQRGSPETARLKASCTWSNSDTHPRYDIAQPSRK